MAELQTVLPEHYEALADYLASFPEETKDPLLWRDRFRLWWDENPAFSNGFERGWLVKNENEIVGFLGSFPSSFQLSGEATVVHNATTWRVSPPYRNFSLRLLSQQMNQAKDSLLFNTTPNEPVIRVLRSLKFRAIQRGDQKNSLLITNFEKVLDSSLGRNGATRLLAKILAPFLRGIQDRRLGFSKEEENFKVEEIDQAHRAFDELWERTKGRYAHTNIRSACAINWYCSGSPYFKKKLFGVFRGETLLAYMIFVTSQNQGLKVLDCVDFWGDFRERQAVKALVRMLKAYAEKHAFDGVKFPGFSKEVGNLFKALGLFQSKPKERFEFFKAPSTQRIPMVEDNTYFPYSIGDRGL